jgi:hypothetical protein
MTLSLASVAIGITVWFLRAHHMAELAHEVQLAFSGLGPILLNALFFATLYLALEPFIRKRHPEMLISWTRLLAGRFKDPLVAGHALIGMGAGAVFVIGISSFAERLLGQPPSIPAGRFVDAVMGTSASIVPFLNLAQQAVGIALATLMLLVGLEHLVRRLWIAGALAVVFITYREALVEHGSFWLLFALFTLLFAVPMYALLRFGAVAFMFSLLTINVCATFPLTSHLGEWYAIPTRLVLLFIASVVFWGLRYGTSRPSAV